MAVTPLPEYPHDDRLKNVEPSQYRLWHDTENVLVPYGKSTTQPLCKESIPTNVKSYSPINKSYFTPPYVDFTNVEKDTKRFDRYRLQSYRENINTVDIDSNPLPFDKPEINYRRDLHLNRVRVQADIIFACDTFKGSYSGFLDFDYLEDGEDEFNVWVTHKAHFQNYTLEELYGDFILATNVTDSSLVNNGQVFITGEMLQKVNLPIYIIVNRATVKNGNSEMPIQLQNYEYPLTVEIANIDVLGGE